MHPLFRRPLHLAFYVLAWLPIGLGLAILLRTVRLRPWADALALGVPLALVSSMAVLSAHWVCRAHPLSGAQDSVWRSLQAQAVAALQTSAVWVALATLYALALSAWGGVHATQAQVVRDDAALFSAGIPLYLLSATLHYLFGAIAASHRAERRVLESQVTAREAELRALRAQLNPHFLFNSLNSINALVGADPESARRMCEGLGDFLRRTLALGAREAVTLGEEIALVDNYLGIEQVRFGDRMRVERRLDPAADACRIPPLLLQPLVENAVKHGIQDCVDGGVITIETRRAGGSLRVAVENPVDPDAPARDGAGVGLVNVRRRLEVFGMEGARLDTERTAGRYRVTLVLPAVDA